MIDVETRDHCGGAVKTIAGIEDPAVIEKIHTHLNKQFAAAKTRPMAREPGAPASRPV